MICAFAIDSNFEIAPTVGTAEFICIESGKERKLFTTKGKPVQIFREQKIDVLFCGGIGMCLLSFLESQGIQVVPGCSGKTDSLPEAWKDGKLLQTANFLCSDQGRTCGSCPGLF